MPSNAFSAELTPEPRLRRIVFGSGVASGLIGLVVIASLPFAIAFEIAGSVLWSFAALRQLQHLRQSWSGCRRLRILPGGGVAVRGRDGKWQRTELAPGGILLRRWGWIRYRTASGRIAAELVHGCCRKSNDWRRLQVVWRHVGAPGSSC